jgi:3-hydroxybutyrate dehydrogenase
MQVDLNGRTAIMTGAATGLGRVLAEGLVRSGANVMLTDKDKAGAELAAAELTGLGGEVIGRELDVVSDAGIDAIVA